MMNAKDPYEGPLQFYSFTLVILYSISGSPARYDLFYPQEKPDEALGQLVTLEQELVLKELFGPLILALKTGSFLILPQFGQFAACRSSYDARIWYSFLHSLQRRSKIAMFYLLAFTSLFVCCLLNNSIIIYYRLLVISNSFSIQ